MLSEEMMYYINMAVGDGKLESKELEFLKQKAAELGANPIEVEMTATTLATQAKKHVMMEKTHCPNCGAQLNQMTGECEYCNFSFDDSGDSAQFSQEEFSEKLQNLAAEKTHSKKSFGTILLTSVRVVLMLIIILVAGTTVSKYYTYTKIKRGTLEWYAGILTAKEDHHESITIEAQTDEQKQRAEPEGEYKGEIRWKNMTKEEQQAYKENRTKEIADKPLEGLTTDIIVTIIFIGIFLSLVRPPRKSSRQKQLEAEILMYPIPKQQKVIFDLCIQLASQVEPVNKVLCFISTKEKGKVQNNVFWTKKIMQVYQKAKFIFRKEPKILEQLKNLLQTHNITV
jgi:hypothetical protein